jgi:hypothetical protein
VVITTTPRKGPNSFTEGVESKAGGVVAGLALSLRRRDPAGKRALETFQQGFHRDSLAVTKSYS